MHGLTGRVKGNKQYITGFKHVLLQNRGDNKNKVPWERGKHIYIIVPSNLAKMTATPVYCKNLEKNLLQNQKSDNIETWYGALGTQALQKL